MTFSIKQASLLLGALTIYPFSLLAHVGLEPRLAVAGDYAKLVFRVPHGCEGSATTQITVQIPEGVTAVKPQVHAGWKIKTKSTKLKQAIQSHGKEITETISEVTWLGGNLPDAHMDEFGLSLKLPDKAADEKLFFPVMQTCKKGQTHWSHTTGSEPHDHAKSPAPFLVLQAKAQK